MDIFHILCEPCMRCKPQTSVSTLFMDDISVKKRLRVAYGWRRCLHSELHHERLDGMSKTSAWTINIFRKNLSKKKTKNPTHNAMQVLAYCCSWVKLLFSHTALNVTEFRASVKTSFSSCQQQCKLKLFCSLVALCSNSVSWIHIVTQYLDTI